MNILFILGVFLNFVACIFASYPYTRGQRLRQIQRRRQNSGFHDNLPPVDQRRRNNRQRTGSNTFDFSHVKETNRPRNRPLTGEEIVQHNTDNFGFASLDPILKTTDLRSILRSRSRPTSTTDQHGLIPGSGNLGVSIDHIKEVDSLNNGQSTGGVWDPVDQGPTIGRLGPLDNVGLGVSIDHIEPVNTNRKDKTTVVWKAPGSVGNQIPPDHTPKNKPGQLPSNTDNFFDLLPPLPPSGEIQPTDVSGSHLQNNKKPGGWNVEPKSGPPTGNSKTADPLDDILNQINNGGLPPLTTGLGSPDHQTNPLLDGGLPPLTDLPGGLGIPDQIDPLVGGGLQPPTDIPTGVHPSIDQPIGTGTADHVVGNKDPINDGGLPPLPDFLTGSGNQNPLPPGLPTDLGSSEPPLGNVDSHFSPGSGSNNPPTDSLIDLEALLDSLDSGFPDFSAVRNVQKSASVGSGPTVVSKGLNKGSNKSPAVAAASNVPNEVAANEVSPDVVNTLRRIKAQLDVLSTTTTPKPSTTTTPKPSTTMDPIKRKRNMLRGFGNVKGRKRKFFG